MKKKYNNVYQFKITLEGIKPPIWRRIQVPETYTFWDLHVAIQDSMGWLDYHLHQFTIIDGVSGDKLFMGIPTYDDYDFDFETLPGWAYRIADYLNEENEKVLYEYDFGDGWEHLIKYEKKLPCEKGVRYPRCIGGKRACPPEDVGGIAGYEYFLEIINDPDHLEHEEMLEWSGDSFDPEHFNAEEVIFEDPAERFKIAFKDE